MERYFSDTLRVGVRQACLTSPTLFNLYVDDLIEDLSGARAGYYVGSVSVNNINFVDERPKIERAGRWRYAAKCRIRRIGRSSKEIKMVNLFKTYG